MTVEELLAREHIRKTMATYTIAGDRLHADRFIAVFTEDAILESDGVPDSDAFRYVGRDAIHAWMSRWRDSDESTQRPERDVSKTTFIRHHLSTSQVEFVGEGIAKARTYWVAYTDIGPDHCGHYVDQFRRVGAEWLIAHRKVRLDWRSPDSLFTTVIARTR